jgi:GntR family transcriptional regulator/MocR family aminotransferase
MDIHITVEGRHDLTGQIYRQLRAGIVEGRLAGGTRLPSTRDLAAQLGVSRKTTLDVFERLLAEGYLNARPGAGTFVAPGLQRLPAGARARPALAGPPAREAPRPGVHPQPVWAQIPEALSLPRRGDANELDFMGGVTDKTLFPFDVWRRCIQHALRVLARGRGRYRDVAGEQELRLAIARYLAFSRALTSGWDEVMVTRGAQQALDLLARVTLRPGDVAAVEDPGYPPARACFAAAGARVAAVALDAEGIVVERLPEQARLVYVTPAHQFPLGMPMSLARRVALLEWAQKRGALIIEDDYDSEFRFEGRPMEPLKSLDRAGLVAYVGTFSKTLFPELRVGYVLPPEALAGALRKAAQMNDWHGCTLTQTALAKFMLDGDFARHLRRMHNTYAARRACLVAHLQGELGRWFEPLVPGAGIHLAAFLRAPLDEQTVIDAARSASIGLYGLAGFHLRTPAQPGLMFGYGGIGPAQMERAFGTLAHMLPALAR